MSRESKSAAASQLLEEARALSGDFDRLSQAVADRVGLSATDLLAMDLVSRRGQMTPGDLARELHLTTGAITGLVDRLHKAGFVRRVADADDRRRVFVRATAREARVGELYRPLAAGLRRAIEGYSEQELAMLTGFIRTLRSAVGGTIDGVRKG